MKKSKSFDLDFLAGAEGLNVSLRSTASFPRRLKVVVCFAKRKTLLTRALGILVKTVYLSYLVHTHKSALRFLHGFYVINSITKSKKAMQMHHLFAFVIPLQN